MTCPSDRRSTRRPRAGAWRAVVAVLALSVAPAGCGDGGPDPNGPRAAAAALMDRLVDGDVGGVCRSLSARARAELARDFGGASCPATAAAAVRYVRDREGLRRAVRGVTILPNTDVPLSPAPQRAGASRVALRLVVADPVLGSRQAFDIGLHRIGGRWRVDSGIAALFTIVGDDAESAGHTG
jgi:hypothetical protein